MTGSCWCCRVRGRPEKLRCAIDSVRHTVPRRDDVVVVVGIDDDEATMALSRTYKPNVPVLWSSGPREMMLGRLNNRIAAVDHGCMPNPGLQLSLKFNL